MDSNVDRTTCSEQVRGNPLTDCSKSKERNIFHSRKIKLVGVQNYLQFYKATITQVLERFHLSPLSDQVANLSTQGWIRVRVHRKRVLVRLG